jgi:hypothetical protein
MNTSTLLWLVGLFVSLVLINRWLTEALHRVGFLFFGADEAAVILYYILLLPGVVLHECSHWLTATLLDVPTKGISLLPQMRSGGEVQLGSVNVRRSDAIRESLIGLAPLLTGASVILLLARWRLSLDMPLPLETGAIMQTLAKSLQTPDALLWLYLLFSVSNAMLPSESDREPWLPVLAFVGLVAAGVYLTGLVRQVPASAAVWLGRGASYLNFVFALAVAVDIPVLLSLLGLEKAGEMLLGRKVEYRD